MWLLLFAALLIPGLLLACVLRVRNHLALLATPLSLLLIAVVFFSLKLIGETSWSAASYLAITFLLFIWSISNSASRACLLDGFKQLLSVIPIVVAIAAYHLIAGAFIDFGADVYQHLLFIQAALTHINAHNGELELLLKPGTTNLVFHNISALFIKQLGITPQDAIEPMAIAYSSLWSISVFYFSRFVLSKAGVPNQRVYLLSTLALFFYWASFGINNFSFARYYIGGPSILNYGVFLAAMVLIIDQFGQRISVKIIMASGLLISVAFLLHPQEMFFVVAYLSSVAVVILLYRALHYSDAEDLPLSSRNVVLASVVVILLVSLIAVAIALLPKYIFDPVSLRSLGLFSDRLVEWNILRPTHQFYTVLGWWGIYTFGLAIVWFKYVRTSVMLTAAILLPLITVFNPFFAEAYMRLAYPQVLWRMLFAIPLPVMASYLCWLTWSRTGQKNILRFSGLLSIAPLFVLLVPFDVAGFTNNMAKTPSLIRTPEENSYKQWIDLLEYLQSIDSAEMVLTDPSTGYMVRALSKHDHNGFKFYKTNYIDYNFESFDNNPLQKYRGWLLIVNRRDGLENTRLHRPHHIYPDVMLTKRHYSEMLLEEIRTNSNRYDLLWSADLIDVYRIM